MWGPEGLAFDATNNRLFVADMNNDRVLVFLLSGGITNGMNASYVLGQPNLTTGGYSSTTQATMWAPQGLAYDATNNRLFVAEYSDSRVTVFNVAPGTIANGESANTTSGLLGQTSFTTAAEVTTQAGMNMPDGLAYDAANHRLFVADSHNGRVTVFNVAPGFTNDENASNVLGHADFVTGGYTGGQAGMSYPGGLKFDATNNRLFVTDPGNNRVLVFNTTTITNGMNASNVLSQTNFTNNGTATTQAGMSGPFGVEFDATNNRLFVTDSANQRVLEFLMPNAGAEGDMFYNSAYGVMQYCNGTNWMKIGSHSQ
jgi:DNA-binding beta-propeller fold protein YncE